MATKKGTYRDAGVDIDAADKLVKIVRQQARATFTPGVLSEVGFFGGMFQLEGYRQPVLVSSTDGVGTKVKIARQLDRHDTIGADLVNHCVNDILTCGATPLFFQDYIAMSRLVPQTVASVTGGLSKALEKLGCALIGGETAEMPGTYVEDEYDLAGFIVGVVERDGILDGGSIAAGDNLIALPSSGLHTNGYSLVRKIFNTDSDPSILHKSFPQLGRTLGEELLEPHRCYLPVLKPLMTKVKGLAHITGGGLPGNLPRTLPEGLAARVERGAWDIPPVFPLIQQQGNIDDAEMLRVFNMGVGMVVVCAANDTEELLASLKGAKLIGEVVRQSGKQRLSVA